MKKKILASIVALPIALLGWTATFAQDEEDKAAYVTPVDTYTCSYNDGKGPADLKKAIAGWNAWMDEEGTDDYGAFVLTPFYHGADTFEMGWLGYWTSQEAMGAGTDNFLNNGSEAAQGFAEAVTCETHEHFASVNVKPPGDGEAPDSLVLMFSDCSLEDDATYDTLFDSLDEVTAYQDEHNYGNATWFFWPVFGGGGESTYDFKWLTAYDSYTSFGKAYQHHANGGGRQAINGMMGGQLDCDVARVYNAKAVRRPAPPAEE